MASKVPFRAETYIQRRDVLKQKVGSGRILLMGNDEASVNFADNWYQFRQDSSFLYYIGISQPGLHAIIDVDRDQTILFGDDASMDMIIWTGKTPQMEELAEQVGIKQVLPSSQIMNFVDADTAYLPPYRDKHTLLLRAWTSTKALNPSIDLIKAIVQQREIKTEEEITHIDKAVALSIHMHNEVQSHARPGMYEYELVSVASRVALEQNTRWSFSPIMTINGQVLHNHYYGNQLRDGDMVLFDGGVEVESGYCGDITRTFPAGESFTPLQQELYNIVEAAYDTSVELSAPGVYFKDVHLAAGRKILEGLKLLGWVKGDLDEAVAAGVHTMFFQCGLGHMMGLDVHDMENLGEQYVGYTDDFLKGTEFGLKSLRLGKQLQEGNVITIEPGIYIIPELIALRQSEGKYLDYLNYDVLEDNQYIGGIRIEDDFLVTDGGVRKLGQTVNT